MDLDLANKTALVTGAHRGTGQIIATHLAAEGATVWVHGFTIEQAESAAKDIPGARPVAGDITTDEGAQQVLDTIAAAPPEILVNNYGTADRGTWADADTDAWLDAYQKNVISAQRLIRGLLPQMRTLEFARIINLGTVGSTRPNAAMPHYYAAKGAPARDCSTGEQKALLLALMGLVLYQDISRLLS